jgi:N-formylglutamate amidohydrolase
VHGGTERLNRIQELYHPWHADTQAWLRKARSPLLPHSKYILYLQ